MIYHALRLACITFSSIKTWSAVVDSKDRSKARRHMFLWFLILAGLSVEPIADSILSSRIPMYEGIKIMFAGWLLLAHFDISRPESQPPRQNYIIPEVSHNHSSQRAQLETQHKHLHHYPTISRQSSYISTTERTPATPGRGLKADGDSVSSSTMLRATNLDFGRFKRDLDRRRSHSRTHSHITEDAIPARTNSRLGHVEPSPSVPTFHSKEDFKHTPTSASVPRAASSLRGHGSTTSTPTTAIQQVTPVQDPSVTHSGKRSPLGMFLFGSEKSSLKRPSSAMSEDRPSPSLARNTSNLSSRSQQPRPSALYRTPSGQRSGGEHRVRINAESPGGKNKRQRHSPDDRDKFAEPEEDERPRTQQPKDSQNTSSANTGSKPISASTSASIPPTASNVTTSTTFSRPKPPRKNRSKSQPETAGAAASKDHRPQHQSLPESTNRDLFSPSATETVEEPQVVSASFESRMKNVRAWIKGRNPSMISPTLTATSEVTATHPQLKRRSSSFLQQDEKPKSSGGKGSLDDLPKITKRKAARQLAPAANTKRWAAEDDLERPSQWTVEDDDRIQRQNNDGSSRRKSGEGTKREAIRLYPDPTGDSAAPSIGRQRARDFSFSQPMPATRRGSATRILGERSRPSSLPTNVDWDRFQRLIGTAPKRSSSSSTLLTSTVPSNALHRKSSTATLVNHQDDSPTVAPLIKLRQSQLRQRQEEDFFGVKRNDGEGSRNKFDSTLDLWEREDDETLAQNAAREAEEVEARSQLRLSQGRRDSSSSSSLLSRSPEDERAAFTFSSPSRISRTTILATDPEYEMAAPTPSLLRTIPFNGESSRRPVPDFQPKKSASATRLQETIKSSSPARRTSHSGQDNSNPFLEKGTSSGGGGRSAPTPPRFNFNFAGAASLAKKRAQSHQSSHQGAKASPEDVAARRERHPGLYTPSKKKAATSATAAAGGGAAGTNSSEQQGSALWKESQLNRPSSSPFKHPSTPTTMSRYVELSSLSDDDK